MNFGHRQAFRPRRVRIDNGNHHAVRVRTFSMSSTDDKIDGAFHEAKGKIKEEAGSLTGDKSLEARGVAEKIGGKIERTVGEAKEKLSE